MPPSDLFHPQQALAVYAEALIVRRRAVVFGDPESRVTEKLLELGARSAVHVSPGENDDDLRPGSFDVAIVLDLGLFEDPSQVLARARRLVGDAGAAIVAADNKDAEGSDSPRAFDYYELFDLVAGAFADVRMVAALPFYGIALAELGLDGESPEVSVDTQLADAQRVPASFVAIASQRGASLDAYAIVELPAVDEPVVRAEDLDATVTALARETLRADALLVELETMREEVARIGELEGEAVDLEQEVTRRGQAIADLTALLEAARGAADAGVATINEARAWAARAERAEAMLGQVEPELGRIADAHAAELRAFEEALRERGKALRELEVELARRDRMVKDLVATLEEQSGPPAVPVGATTLDEDMAAENARLRQRIDAMALEAARREGEAQANAWAVAELERKLAQAPAAPREATHSGVEERLNTALDEIDALRRALTQEHDQRVRAEAAAKRPTAPDLEPQA